MENPINLNGWKIVNIRRGKKERRHIIYAELRDEKGELVVSATLEYIEARIKSLLPTPQE